MEKNICLFPGTFDPITLGHIDIINRGLPLFDELIVAIGINSSKVPMFDLEQRINWIQKIFKDNKKVKVIYYEGLTINICKKLNAKFILRGIRFVNDFEYEKNIADVNKTLNDEIETIFLTCSSDYSSISSTTVRELIKHNGEINKFLHEVVISGINPQFI